MTALPGASFRLDSTGRVIAIMPDSGGQADGLIQITGSLPSDPAAVILALHTAGAIALPIVGKYTVNYQTLANAAAMGTRLVLTPA